MFTCTEKEVSLLLTETRYEHIKLSENQVPMISGTTMKVIELIADHLAYGWSPEELRLQHPYLTMGQIHSALAYYWDHKPELDQDIEKRLQFVDQIQQAALAESSHNTPGPFVSTSPKRLIGLPSRTKMIVILN